MKIELLVVVVLGLSLTWTTWADDLAQLGYSPGTPVKALVAKGVSLGSSLGSVDGPYACTTEQEVRQITSDHSDLREVHMVENLRAYYLIPGALARVIQDDHAQACRRSYWQEFSHLIAEDQGLSVDAENSLGTWPHRLFKHLVKPLD